MLKDERARALGSNFAGQWLFLRNLRGLQPDADVFPDFDHNLREGLQRETELLFESIVLDDKSVLRLLDADYTFVNERLARHYGIPNVYGTQFRKVTVADDARRGLLGHGSILALTSQNNRTSPVLRGKYVLTNILGTPPPEPPADVPPLDETPGKARSMRDRMEEHRRNPACAGCHKLMDPIGLSLENFDGIGKWRTVDNGATIDASAQLADGSSVEGPAALRQALLRRPEMFARNVTEMLLTYALGHRVEYYDMPYVRTILKESAQTDYRFSSLVLGIIKSRAVSAEEIRVMMITKKAIPRRTVLRGLGATVALPLLDSMVPAATALAQTAAAPTSRFGFVYVPHGSIMREWTPAQEGTNFEFSPILKPLESFRKHVTVMSNLSNYGENGHSVSSAMWLSGTFPSKGSLLKLGTTVDQLIAQKIGRASTFPSMEFATEDHSSHLGSCAGDFLCSYMSTICWASANQPLPMEINPRVVFERMFGGDRATPEERRARLEKNTSILDAVAESARELQPQLGRAGSQPHHDYMDNVREIERRIVTAEQQRDETGIEAPPTPVGVPENWEEHVDADVRPDGTRLPGQPDARDLVHDGARAEHPELSADRRRRRPSPGVAQQQHPGAGGQEDQGATSTTWISSRSSSTSCRRRPTATAACSITRCSSTAAA